MKAARRFPIRYRAFTLIELLVVISIIAILAAMLLPVISRVKVKAQIKQAQTDMYNLKGAISHYDTEYSRLPGTNSLDTTFGVDPAQATQFLPDPTICSIARSNTDVMVILLNEDRFVNLNHAKNPQQNIFFEGKRNPDTTRPGISTLDWQFRDPWGNPYLITVDLDYDGKCYDAFYRQKSVSLVNANDPVGYNGLRNDTDTTKDLFAFPGDVMIWSMGPDGKADNTKSANTDVNKDNVIGW